MKQLIKNYTFSTSAKTITLTDFSAIRLDRIQLIVDSATNKILYNFADPSVSTAAVATNVITLSALQGGEANGDALQIVYEVISGDPVYDGGQRAMANSMSVVLASDQSSIPVAATLNAETTKAIGVVRTADGAGNLLTSTANALDINIKSGNPTSITANAGTNLNTSALALESGGNLATLAAAVSSNMVKVNTANLTANTISLNVFPGTTVSTGNTWNSATSLNATTTIYDSNSTPFELPPAVAVQLDQTSTLTAGAITFEGYYDNTAWLTVPANIVLDPTSASYAQVANPYTLQGNTNKPFLIVNNGWRALRIRLSTAITGTGAVTPHITLLASSPVNSGIVYSPTASNFQVTASAGTNLNTSALALESGGNLATIVTNTGNAATSANQTNGNQQAKITDGTNVASVLSGDSGNNSQVIAGARKEVSFTTTTVQAVASTDISNYASISLQITGQGGSSTVNFQGSNDNSTWVAVPLMSLLSQADYVTSTTSTGFFVGPKNYRYFRLNVTGIASGTTAGVIEFSALPTPTLFANVMNKANANIAVSLAGQTAAINIANTSPAALADTTTNPTTVMFGAMSEVYNGASWDRQRGNLDNISLLASASHTTTQTAADQTNYNARGVVVTLDVTASSSGSITLEIDYKDPVSGKYVALLTGAAVTGTGTTQYTVYPGITAAANAAASMVLPRTWRAVVTANNSNSMTYSVGASLMV